MKRLLAVALLLAAGFPALAADEDAKKKKKDVSAELEKAYKMLDGNSDNKLTPDEFKNLATAFPQAKKAEKDLDGLFAKLDADKDKVLSLDEFKKLPEHAGKKKKKDDK